MKNYKIIALSISVILIIVFGILLAYNIFILKEVKKLDMYYEVGKKIGINVDNDALHFGKTPSGGGSKRRLKIENNHDFPLTVSIKVSGEISPFVTVSNNDFVLHPGASQMITYFVFSNKDTPDGHYNGETKILMTRNLFV